MMALQKRPFARLRELLMLTFLKDAQNTPNAGKVEWFLQGK